MKKSKIDKFDVSNDKFKIQQFINLNSIKSYPHYFFQIINTSNKNEKEIKKEPHIHYNKLNQVLKRENIDLSLIYLNIQDLKENQLNKICEIFGITEKELYLSDYLISNDEGEFICHSKDKNNFEIIQKFISGIQKVSDLKDFQEIISNLSEETIFLITNGVNKKSQSNKILKKFYIETQNCYNNNTYFPLQANLNSDNIKLEEDEIFLFLNKNLFEFKKDYIQDNKVDITVYDEINDINIELSFKKYFPLLEKFYNYDQKFFQEDQEKISKSDEDHLILLKEKINKINYNLEDDYIICLKIKFDKINENSFNKNYDVFTKILSNLISIKNNSGLNHNPIIFGKSNSSIEKEKKNYGTMNFSNIISKNNYTDNVEIAIFNKIEYFKNKDKILILYLNKENLILDSNFHYDMIRNQIFEIIEKLKFDFPYINFLTTSNPSIFNLFNLIPSGKENISIRFLDYSKFVYFNKNSKDDFSIINFDNKSDLNQIIKNLDKNLIFNYKTNFAEFKSNLNYDNLKEFVNESINMKNSKKNVDRNYLNIKPYLECADSINNNVMNQFNNIINLNSMNFKTEILDVKNYQNLILLFNRDCNGCHKIESLLNELLERKKINDKLKIYRYDTMNENLHFKKFRYVPTAVLFQNGKIIEEFDLQIIINNNDNHDDALTKLFNDIIEKQYIPV